MNRMLNQIVRAVSDPARLSDSQLLAAFLEDRSEPAFAALVGRHGPMVLAACRRVLRHQQDAEDAFQATFLVLARRAADVWPRDAIGSWLHGVACRVAWKSRTMRTRRQVHEQAVAAQSSISDSAPAEPDLAEVIDRAMRKLPEIYRAAVVACDLEGRSRKEAAEQLGWKEGTLSGRLARARQLLASRLRKAGLTLPAAGIGAAIGTGESLSADQITNTIQAALGSASGDLSIGVSARVAMLTEGMLRGMFMTKIKTAVVALLTVGAIGFGMWSSAGAGDGRGGAQGAALTSSIPVAADGGEEQPAKLPPDLEKFQGNWWILAKGEGAKLESFDPNTARDPRHYSVAIHGSRFIPPNPGPASDWLFLSQEMKLVLDPAKNPRQFDLVHDAGRITGIYEFPKPGPKDELILIRLVLTTEGARPTAFEPRGPGAIELILGRYADPNKDPSSNTGLDPKNVPDLTAAEQRLNLAYQDLQLAVQEFKTRKPAKDLDQFGLNLDRTKARVDQINQLIQQSEAELLKARLQLKPAPKLPRLAAGADSARPGESAAQPPLDKGALKGLEGKWRITTRGDGKTVVALDPKTDDARLLEVEFRAGKFIMPYRDISEGIRTNEYEIWRLDPSKSPAEIDLISPKKIVGRGIYKLEGNKLTVSIAPTRPTKFGEPGDQGIEMTLVRLPEEKPPVAKSDLLEQAKARRAVELEKAKLDVELAQEEVVKGTRDVRAYEQQLLYAQARLADAKNRLAQLQSEAAPKPPAAAKGRVNIRVRPVSGPETVVAWQYKPNLTVQIVLTEMKVIPPLTTAVDVWIIRPTKAESNTLVVDWAGITSRGETKTNHLIEESDTIVVQFRPGK